MCKSRLITFRHSQSIIERLEDNLQCLKDSIDFVLKEHMTLAAFQLHIDNFDSGVASEDVESDDSKMPGFSLKD